MTVTLLLKKWLTVVTFNLLRKRSIENQHHNKRLQLQFIQIPLLATLIVTIGTLFALPLIISSEQWMVDPFISVVTLIIIWLVNGLLEVRVTVNAEECKSSNCRTVVLVAP